MKVVKTQHFSVWTIEGPNKGSVELVDYLKSQGVTWDQVTSWKYENNKAWIVVIKGYRSHDNCDSGGV